ALRTGTDCQGWLLPCAPSMRSPDMRKMLIALAATALVSLAASAAQAQHGLYYGYSYTAGGYGQQTYYPGYVWAGYPSGIYAYRAAYGYGYYRPYAFGY